MKMASLLPSLIEARGQGKQPGLHIFDKTVSYVESKFHLRDPVSLQPVLMPLEQLPHLSFPAPTATILDRNRGSGPS